MGERPQIGFIAQEVGQAVPEAVVGIGDGYLGIDYAKLVAVLTGAVQEQQAEIASLRARLAALDGQTWNNPCLAGDVLLVRNAEEAACFRVPLAGAATDRAGTVSR